VVGILQAEFTAKPEKNLEIIARILLEKYKGADIVVLPEYSMIDLLSGLTPREVYSMAEDLENSSFVSKLSDLASKLGTQLLAHVIEKTEWKPRCRSSTVLVKPSSGYERVYSKIHLFDAYGYRESHYLVSGNQLSKPISVKGYTFFAAICYDLRFPELFRSYALKNAYGAFVQAGWVKGPLKEEVLDKLAGSRSHENTMYIVLANQTGKQYTGRSGVFNPFGFRELDLGFKPNYAEHEIDPKIVEEAREQIPVVRESSRKWVISFTPLES